MKLNRPTTLYRWLALAPLAVLLASCNDGLLDLDRGSALRQAMERWQQSGVTSYRYTFTRQCFCPREIVGPVVVEVRNGQTVSVTPGEGVTTIRRDAFNPYDTVEDLFAAVQAAADRKPFRLDASYDETDGHPFQLYADFSPNAADDEDGFVISGFQRL